MTKGRVYENLYAKLETKEGEKELYSSVMRPAMVYGLEMVAVTKKQVEEMEVAEMKMLKFAMEATRKDEIRKEYTRGTIKVEQLGMKMRESRLM